MGWDVFISHASEDKPNIAVPLKHALEQLGISVWIDIEQIKLGDSFRTAIDWGLQQCRFGVVILSPRFFKKQWAKAELDAFLNMEMSASGQKRLLPVLCDMSFDELGKFSPLIAGRRVVPWKDGIETVVQAIAEVVTGVQQHLSTTAHPHASPPHQPLALDSLVLFLMNDGRIVFIESLELESGTEGLELTVKCTDASDAAIVQELGNADSKALPIAFGTTAMLGRVTDARLKRSGGQQIGILKIKNVGPRGGNPMEMSFNNISADKLAEMRARKILLGEQFPWKTAGTQTDVLNQGMMDMFVAGFDAPFKANESPIPPLYAQLSATPDVFVAVAKLASVMFLCLSNAVETITRLDFRLEGTTLGIDFAGRRAKRFTNVDPPIIEVKGTFKLK